MNKKNYILLVLSVLAFLTISSSFAYFVMEVTGEGSTKSEVTTGTLKVSISDSALNITNGAPIYDSNYSEYAFKKSFTLNNTGSLNACSNVYLNIKNISDVLKSPYFRYALVSSDEKYFGGFNRIDNNTLLLGSNVFTPASTNKEYTLYIWLSYSDYSDQNAFLNTSVSSYLSIDSTDCRTKGSLNKVKLTINPNGGTYNGSTSSVTSEEEEFSLKDISIPVKNNSEFAGWDITGDSSASDSTVAIGQKDTTITARYLGAAYKVTFDANGGSVSTKSKTVRNNGTYGELPVASKNDGTFKGWYTSKTGGTLISSDSVVNLTSDITLYARYSGVSFSTYLANNLSSITFDGEVQYRYQGANVNNYVTFNGETWRIIGVINTSTLQSDGAYKDENLVKIMRNTSIGTLAWNTSSASVWSSSSLASILNAAYLNRTGNYSSTGITDEARSMIANVKWNVNAVSQTSTTLEAYSGEKATTWNGYVGLFSYSDYGLMSKSCYANDTKLSNYNKCTSDTWFDISAATWSMTPSTATLVKNALEVKDTGAGDIGKVSLTKAVKPAVYLNNDVVRSSGDGSSSNPYVLTLE